MIEIWRKSKAKTLEVGSAMVFEVTLVLSAFIVFPLTIKALSPAQYGRYTTLYTIAGFAVTWVYASGGSALVQMLLQKGKTLSSSLRVGRRQVVYLAVPSAAIGLVVTGATIGVSMLGPALIVFGSDLFLAGIAEMNISAVYALRDTTNSTKIRLVGPLSKCLGIVFLTVIHHASLLTLVLNNLLSTVAVFGASILMLRTISAAAREDAESRCTWRELLRLSTIYAVSMSAYTVQDNGDNLALAAFRPAAEVGQYAAAYRLVSTAMLPLRAVTTAAARWFLPPDDRAGGHLRKSVRLLIPTAGYGVVCGIGIIAVRPLTSIVVGTKYHDAVDITVWLAGFPLMRAVSDLPTLGLLGLGRNRLRMILGLGGASVAAIAYVTLIPRIGWRGGVIGTYISESAVALAGWYLLVRCQRIADAEYAEQLASGGGVVDAATVAAAHDGHSHLLDRDTGDLEPGVPDQHPRGPLELMPETSQRPEVSEL